METYLPSLPSIANDFRGHRCIYDGYQRGWGLEHGNLRERILQDEDYQHAIKFAEGRSLVSPDRLMNLFLLIKFYLSRLSFGHIIEYGAYRGGSAFFMAAVAAKHLPGVQVYALDTFCGMPPPDKSVDAHDAGNFSSVKIDELMKTKADYCLTNVHFVKGLFSNTATHVLAEAKRIALAHIDCDLYEGVKYSYLASKPYMVDRGYYVFDDSVSGSCLGATQAVEEVVIQRDGLLSEQIFPHHVFRAFPSRRLFPRNLRAHLRSALRQRCG